MKSSISSQARTSGYHAGNAIPPLDTPDYTSVNGQHKDLLDENYLTVHELADTLRLSPMTVYRVLEDGELNAVRVGAHSIRIPESSAKGYLECRRLPLHRRTWQSRNLLAESYLTVQELAGILRVSVMTVYRVLEDGALDAVRVAPHVIRIVKTGAEQYMRSATLNTPQPPASPLPLPPAHMRPGPARFA